MVFPEMQMRTWNGKTGFISGVIGPEFDLATILKCNIQTTFGGNK